MNTWCAMWELVQKSMTLTYVRAASILKSEKGQGTTEYAILVGILVVIAVLAIALFRPKIQELWSSIAESINAL